VRTNSSNSGGRRGKVEESSFIIVIEKQRGDKTPKDLHLVWRADPIPCSGVVSSPGEGEGTAGKGLPKGGNGR